MSSPVPGQVSRLSKSHPAVGALEGLLSRMGPHMLDEIAVARKGLAALFALVGLVLGVNSHVTHQRPVVGSPEVALSAQMRFRPGVTRHDVRLEVPGTLERRVALCALVGPRAVVHAGHVLPEDPRAGEPLPADGAHVVPLPRVGLHVSFQSAA